MRIVKTQPRCRAFTLIEIMIVVAIIGIVSIPNYMKARNETQRKTCINNLRSIDRFTQEWAFEHNKVANDTYSLTDPTCWNTSRAAGYLSALVTVFTPRLQRSRDCPAVRTQPLVTPCDQAVATASGASVRSFLRPISAVPLPAYGDPSSAAIPG